MECGRYLAEIFDELTAASSQDACAGIALGAARTLADVDGLCLLSPEGDRCLVAATRLQQLYSCDLRGSGLYRAAAALRRVDSAGPRRRGFGRELTGNTLPYELGAQARLHFEPGGLRCAINIPLDECAVEGRPAVHAGDASQPGTPARQAPSCCL